MKFLILILLSFSALSQHRVVFTPNDSSQATQFVESDSLNKALEDAKKVVNGSNIVKGVWVIGSDSLLSRTTQDLENNEIVEGFESSTHTISTKDVTEETQQRLALKALAKSKACGSRVVDLINIRNSSKTELSASQFGQMINKYQVPMSLLNAGALESSKELIQVEEVDGVLFTESDKTYAIAQIDLCLQ